MRMMRVRYCNKECQVKGWKAGHKKACFDPALYKAVGEGNDMDTVKDTLYTIKAAGNKACVGAFRYSDRTNVSGDGLYRQGGRGGRMSASTSRTIQCLLLLPLLPLRGVRPTNPTSLRRTVAGTCLLFLGPSACPPIQHHTNALIKACSAPTTTDTEMRLYLHAVFSACLSVQCKRSVLAFPVCSSKAPYDPNS